MGERVKLLNLSLDVLWNAFSESLNLVG